jgi:peptidoglycan/xylan/chitin deacetylase (PgdA/CDA1 family)
MKYVIIGFDDNSSLDKKAVELLNKYRMKGTFFMNSGTIDKPGYITKEELKTVFHNHEIASHTINHLNLTGLSIDEVEYQIKEDIEFFESYSDQSIIGLAYPFGEYNDEIIKICKTLGVKYARTLEGTKDFNPPKNFMVWNPTLHFSGLAWNTNEDERRKKGIKFMLDKLEEFLDDEDAELFHVWLHTWEFGSDLNKWDEFERLLRILSYEDVEVVTYKEYYDYRN